MTDRRSHWSDDLIEAVKDAISGWCFDRVEGPLYDEDVYPVIAAVEDWQVAKAGPGKYAITLGVIGGKYLPEWIAQSAIDRATKAEAAIARVRDVCDLWQRRHDTYIRRPDDIPAIPITAVLRALGPVTETDCHGGDS